MRHTRSHTANRRSHHALKGARISVCPDCKTSMKPHTACLSCGKYRGRVIIDIVGIAAKKEKKAKARATEAR